MGRPTKGIRIKQRDNGFWYVVWPGNNKGESTGTRDRGEAEQTLAGYIINQRHVGARGERLTVADALDIYMAEHVEPRTKLAGRVVRDVRTAGIKSDFLKAFFGDKAVADLMPDDITHPQTGYIAMRCAGKVVRTAGAHMQPCEPHTIRRDLGVLVAAVKWCSTVKDAKTGAIRLPREHVPVIPLPPQSPRRERWLTLEEENRLLAAVPETEPLSRIHRFVVLALEDGARSEAIRELTWFQVDFAHGTVDYRKPGAAPQNNKRRAKVLMTSRSRAMLEKAFAGRQGALVLDHAGPIDKSFRYACRRAGLEGVTPHTLRHTWATRAARNGVPMRQIADQLADDASTIERNYYHHSPDYMKEAASWRDKEAKEASR
ncbi:MAG: tyrosine-type recombinase/integrase [Solirubrobacteraceae bacterium]